jgi:exodeoxyribonuclease-5
MTLTPEQSTALDAIGRWLIGPRQTFSLAGYAGTGKTTLLQHFINAQPNIVTCCAPTGKAASVLQKRLTNANVSTIHRAIYTPVAPSIAKLETLEMELLNHPNNQALQDAIREEKARLSKKDLKFNLKQDVLISRGQLVVIDEASMVTRRMRKDLEDTGAKILYVGDPGQLPPVRDDGFFSHCPPDVMLVKVQRQALDSPIIRISMQIRNGEEVPPTSGPGAFRKMPKKAMPALEWLAFDQVITGKNDSRRSVNRYFRRHAGRDMKWPQDGDRLICLKNDRDADTYFINGIQATAISNFDFNPDFGEIQGDILYEGQIIRSHSYYRYPFAAHYDYHMENGKAVIDCEEDPPQSRRGLREFDYAYGITVHKSQGSEWGRVLFADDHMAMGADDYKKWLYTAVTRAREELVWLY